MRIHKSLEKVIKSRTKSVSTIIIVLFVVLIGRLFLIQIIRNAEYREKADNLTVRKIVLHARRGTIYDRYGNKLAVSVEAYDIAARPSSMKDREAIAKQLSSLLGLDPDKLLYKFNHRDRFFYVARRVDSEIGAKIKDAKLEGVDVIPTTKRIYPNGELAAHIIGYTDADGKGIEGIERSFNDILGGSDGYRIAELDARGVIIPGTSREQKEPVDGKDIVLTIDSTLQHTLETELANAYNRFSAAGASAVIMDPKTGEILALANMPTYDPNKPSKSKPDARRNRAVSDLYEPGSTLKTITACAALESKIVGLNEIFYCNGRKRIGKQTIRCSLHGKEFRNGHGAVDIAKMLKYSCNIAAASMGLKMGREKLHEYETAFGLYEKPDSGMSGESAGWPDPWQNWVDIHTANVAFGQGIAVTPLQMAKAYSAVANGGNLMKPSIVKELREPSGVIVKKFDPIVVRRVVSVETARRVAEMLGGVVDEGTGKSASVEGYTVGGKTGSAQKASRSGRGYMEGKYIASFAGLIPISNPRIVMLVMVDEPKGSSFGAVVAAPVFQAVAKKAMWHLRVPPDALTSHGTSGSGTTVRWYNHQSSGMPNEGG